ncbi:unnamed protein product [Meloidogyne enterolobii]|uniref:Uncharacterized protein n=1 Tax=Meloidogyne enterolobii TaxID=390850 RepID=A0ACB1A390_MELEN
MYYNQHPSHQNIHHPPQFTNSNFHQHPDMFSTNHYPPHYPPQYHPNFVGHQQFSSNYPNNIINFGDSPHPDTMLNFQQNLPANEGYHPFYNPDLAATQQATPSSFNIEETRASRNMIASTSGNLAPSHTYLNQEKKKTKKRNPVKTNEEKKPKEIFKHSNEGGFQPWRPPNEQPSNPDIQHSPAHEQPSSPHFQYPNIKEIDLNVKLDSPYEESNDPQLQHSPEDSTHSTGFDSQNLTHGQPSRTNIQHSNSEGFETWTHADSIQRQSSSTPFQPSNFGAFQTWKQTKLPESSNPPNIEEFQPSTQPKKPQGFRPYKKRG